MSGSVEPVTPAIAKRPTGVAIVEDRAAIRENVAMLIGSAVGFRCVGSFASMEEALEQIGRPCPDVVLVDLVLPGMSAVEGIGLLRDRWPGVAAVVFTVYEDDERIFDALCRGALGCLPKKTPPRVLLETLAEVAAGGAAPMPTDAARRLLQQFSPKRLLGMFEGVPPAEIRLLELLAEGHNHETAARELGSTPRAVSRTVRSVYGRLHASFRTKSVR